MNIPTLYLPQASLLFCHLVIFLSCATPSPLLIYKIWMSVRLCYILILPRQWDEMVLAQGFCSLAPWVFKYLSTTFSVFSFQQCHTSRMVCPCECMVYDNIIVFVSPLSPYRFGFLSRWSVVQQLLILLNKIISSFSTHSQTNLLYLDINKAFNSIHHNNLLLKLWHCGTWLKNEMILWLVHVWGLSKYYFGMMKWTTCCILPPQSCPYKQNNGTTTSPVYVSCSVQ